jgi:chitinase
MMKLKNILLSLVMFITFIGGFFAGIFYEGQQPAHVMYTTEQLEQSTKNPDIKQLPIVQEDPRVLIGYIQDFRDPQEVDYANLTHIIFSFAHPQADGRVTLNGENAIKSLRNMVSLAKPHNTKVILAVGGWFHMNGGESYGYFKDALSNSSSRAKLVDELVAMVEREDLDGIDIDFEHPRSRADASHLSIFMKDLSSKLHQMDKELSIAVNAKVHSVAGTEINNVVYNTSMFQYVDHVNIMAYDGQWDGGYDAANLSPYHYNQNIVKYWTSLFDRHQISKEKLVLGVPFYAQPVDPTIKQISFETIVNADKANAWKDTVELNGTIYHYNGLSSVQKKTKLALDNGFGGMMLWEAGHDAQGDYSLTNMIAKTLENAQLTSLKDTP